eukprot:g83308.t1
MQKIEVVLFNPRIPGNTGTIARTVLGFGARLVLINPLFQINDRMIARAGLGFWHQVDTSVYTDWAHFKTQHLDAPPLGPLYGDARLWFFSKKATSSFFQACFYPDHTRWKEQRNLLVFGSESFGLDGLDESELRQPTSSLLRLPQRTETIRSHNLACSVAMGLVECERQRQVMETSHAQNMETFTAEMNFALEFHYKFALESHCCNHRLAPRRDAIDSNESPFPWTPLYAMFRYGVARYPCFSPLALHPVLQLVQGYIHIFQVAPLVTVCLKKVPSLTLVTAPLTLALNYSIHLYCPSTAPPPPPYSSPPIISIISITSTALALVLPKPPHASFPQPIPITCPPLSALLAI